MSPNGQSPEVQSFLLPILSNFPFAQMSIDAIEHHDRMLDRMLDRRSLGSSSSCPPVQFQCCESVPFTYIPKVRLFEWSES